MRVVRAWPDNPPGHRPRCEDFWPRVPVDNYDYRALAKVADDVILMDWDTAVGLEELRAFAGRCRERPADVRIAPCRLYQDGDADLPVPKWNVKKYNPGMITLRYVEPPEATCHLFGFGLTYLPAALIEAFIDAKPGWPMDDTSFACWHHQHVTPEAAIDWSVRAVHLHYRIPDGGIL